MEINYEAGPKEQWQDAVDAAELLARITTAKVLLFLELARAFGLLDEDGELMLKPVIRSSRTPAAGASCPARMPCEGSSQTRKNAAH